MSQPHGVPLEQTFAREEIAIPVKCNVHPWMNGLYCGVQTSIFRGNRQEWQLRVEGSAARHLHDHCVAGEDGHPNQKVTVAAGEAKTLDFAFKQ